jgi:hypothetical protein
MATLKFRPKPKVGSARKRRTIAQLPEATGLSGAARRVNRLVAAMVLFGAFGTVALAVALTPGAQQSASVANASQGTPAVSEAASEPIVVEIATPPEPVFAALPPREAKSDRLFRTPRAERPAKADLALAARPLRTSERREAGALAFAKATQKPEFEVGGRGPQLDLDAERETIEFGLSEPPAPGDTSDDASAEAIEEAAEDALDEAVEQATAAVSEEAAEGTAEQAVEDPEPEVAAVTRTAPVTTDVNMRAGPSNDAAVIQVVRRNREVEVIGCKFWCEVIYDGKRGFIYKGFVRGS